MENTRKYFFISFLLIFGGTTIGVTLLAAPSFFDITPPRPGCETPIHWSLGSVDSRFPLDAKQFNQAIMEAEKIWEDTLGRDLFVFDPQATFKITTKFDHRQEMTYEAQDLEKNIENYKKISASMENDYQSVKTQYEKELLQFEALKKEFDKKLAAYNKAVADWNSGDRTSTKELEKLQETEKDLKKLQKQLQEKSDSVNKIATKLNSLAQKFNSQTATVNTVIETFREKYGEPKPFIQGLYYPPLGGITIFEFKGKEDLRLVLAHEMGHALGILEHIENNPAALMYYLMDQQDIANPSLTQEDLDAYAAICPPMNFSQVEKIKRYLIHTPWNKMRISEMFRL